MMGVRHYAELGENLQKIVGKLLRVDSSQDLLKLLYYTDKDPLSQPDITDAIVKSDIYEKLIKITPRVTEQDQAKSIIVVRVVRATEQLKNDQFQDVRLEIDVFVPLTQWIIKNSNLRPFAILGEIEKLLDGLTINGLGKLHCGGFELTLLTDEMSCYTMTGEITMYD